MQKFEYFICPDYQPAAGGGGKSMIAREINFDRPQVKYTGDDKISELSGCFCFINCSTSLATMLYIYNGVANTCLDTFLLENRKGI